MGSNKLKNRKKRLAKKKKKQNLVSDLSILSLEEILALAREKIDLFDYEEAQRLCQAALVKDADHVPTLEISASLCLEQGNMDGARQCLGRAITMQPEKGHGKYLSMAQLLSGQEALQCYIKGTEILQIDLSGLLKMSSSKETVDEDISDDKPKETITASTNGDNTNAEASSSLISSKRRSPTEVMTCRKELSTVHCSIAELFMTDLCDEENAEEQCELHIKKSIEIDGSNPEAHQSFASFLLVKQDFEAARQAIHRSVNLWLPQLKAVVKGEAEPGTFDPVEVCSVDYDTRLNAIKMLIEVEDLPQAIEALEILLEEDDEVVDSWYLLGWAHYQQGNEQHDSARYYLRKAMKVNSSNPCGDEQLIAHTKELLQEMSASFIEDDEDVPTAEEEQEAQKELQRLEDEDSDGEDENGASVMDQS